jgi:molecular chaperone HtpG
MGQSQHDIQIALEGLISLLAQNLYADPDVFLREMIQNAHDSITKRAALAREAGEPPPPPGVIRVGVHREGSALTIEDNGAGLTLQEMHDYLSTIGRSGTRELRDRLETRDRDRAESLIGQFGIGLLSAFIVAKRVEVVTHASGHAPLRWVSDGGKQYTVEEAAREAVGSTVTLHLRPDHGRYLDAGRLRDIVRTYADFLGVPVYLGDDPEPANAVHAPWHRSGLSADERQATHRAYWERHFKDEHSLDVLPLDETFSYIDPTTAEKRTGRVQGVLGITDRHVPDVNSRGTVDVYVRRMFVVAGSRDALPPWARFIQGVIECDALTPNAARDNVVRNEVLEALRDGLGAVIVAHLTRLSKDDPGRFTEIMRWHAYHVLGMAVQSEHLDFFRAVADLVPLASDSGPMTVREYLTSAASLGDGRRMVHYIAERGATAQFFLLCRSKGLRVFDTGEPFAEQFLERYAREWPERVSLNRIDVASSTVIFEKVGEDEAPRYRALEAAYGSIFPDLRCIARAARFKPVDLPAVLTASSDATTQRQMQELAGNLAVPSFIRDVVGRFLKEKRDPLTLHLNVDNPTIQRLVARRTLLDEAGENALVALYNNALMLLARSLRSEDIEKMFAQYNRVIDLMLRGQDERAELLGQVGSLRARVETLEQEQQGRGGLSEVVTCFVAMPFDGAYDGVYAALREVLEDVPFLWRIGRADDLHTQDRGLWENVERQMATAHCFIAEVSEPNPNVMIEVGRMEALRRPILLLKRKGSPDLPADLRGRLYVEYDGGQALAKELRERIALQQHFVAQRGERALTVALLRRNEEIPLGVAQKLAVGFTTHRALLDAEAEKVAARAGVSATMVRLAQEWVREELKRLPEGGGAEARR